ncbi:uncharacterized protein [Dendropsophus ebraccatus]|uniref:uncharacterized protein n=1 Tax=Dendropsophus ebraccatus TaxID=150705 RepID=UPI003831AF69
MASIKVIVYILMTFSVAQADYHVQAGTSTSICGFKCVQPNGLLLLKCRDRLSIFVAFCENSTPEVKKRDNERLSLNHSSGCILLTDVQQNDSCIYEIQFRSSEMNTIVTSTSIVVLDAIKILNISKNVSRLGSDISLHVQFSGVEATVSWEVDGVASPRRYQLVDNNSTLIIRDVTDDDTKRKFVVRVKNPISEDASEYLLDIQGSSEDARDNTHGEIRGRSYLSLMLLPCSWLVIGVAILLICTIQTKAQYRMQETESVVSVV